MAQLCWDLANSLPLALLRRTWAIARDHCTGVCGEIALSQLSLAWWFGFPLEFWMESIACFRRIFVQILLKFFFSNWQSYKKQKKTEQHWKMCSVSIWPLVYINVRSEGKTWTENWFTERLDYILKTCKVYRPQWARK